MMSLGTVNGDPAMVKPPLNSLHTQKHLHPVLTSAWPSSFPSQKPLIAQLLVFKMGDLCLLGRVRLKQVTHAAFACAPVFVYLLLFYPHSRVQHWLPAN